MGARRADGVARRCRQRDGHADQANTQPAPDQREARVDRSRFPAHKRHGHTGIAEPEDGTSDENEEDDPGDDESDDRDDDHDNVLPTDLGLDGDRLDGHQ
jgi:hypothetical protein